MKTIKLAAFLLPAVVAIASLPASAEQQQVYRYQCNNGKTFEAEYSSETAQLKLGENETLTLKQTPAASGVRYTDDRTTLFTKGNQAFIEVENQRVFDGCVAQDTTNQRRIRALW
ncbi:MliC family protein [Aerosakkonemataceae cyanobacterium BLCC-F154]|uniref:MliC family protein n=1 Tax=Floridaenema fluviatile BLCC-F154 TaxID=3153640 RepID=A0ABV4YGX7_9CYAN